METPVIVTMLGNITSIFDFVISCAGDVLTMIINNPLLTLMVPGFIAVGYVVSWVGKLIRQ